MNILVTGATRGIGKAICNTVSEGNRIFAASRNEELLSCYNNFCVCDLSQEEDIEKLGDYIKTNDIDVLINNAGGYINSSVENLDLSEINSLIKLNLVSPVYLISKAVPHMKEKKWGRIINIGSISGVMGEAYASVYSASKAGIIGATKAIALELAEYGITINTINPGWVNTEMGNESANDGDWTKEEIIQCIPQKRFVAPEEIAGLVKYLISDEAKGITGQSINLCAGMSVGY